MFDENPARDVRGVFLDISKAFDKVWHDGPIFKLKAYDIEGKLPSLLENYLQNREQNSCFKWTNISVEKNKFWSSTRISIRTSIIFDLHK